MKVYMFTGKEGQWMHVNGATLYRMNTFGRWDMSRLGLLELFGKERKGELVMLTAETTEFVGDEQHE